MSLWLFLHFPHLLLDYQLALQPLEAGQHPRVLVNSQGARRLVVQANRLALEQGVAVNMAEVLASTMLPDLIVHDYQAEREPVVLRQLAQILYQEVAHIALYPPQGMLFEVQSLMRLHGGYQGVLERIQQRLQQWPLRYSLSSGLSPLTAQLLAESQQPIATQDTKVIQAKIAQLPIELSGLPQAQIERLRDVGLLTLGALLQRSRAELGARFGRAITHYLAQLMGEVTTPQHYYQPPARFNERIELTAEVEHWQQLLFPLKRLLQQVESFLQIHQYSTRALQIRAHHRQGPATQVNIQFAHAVWQQSDLLSLSQLHLERQQLPEPVLALSVKVLQPEARQVKRQQLFAAAHESQQTLSELVSRLQARLGEQKVQSLQLQHDWRPERQGGLAPWRANAAEPALSIQRPNWLLPEAQPIDPQHWQVQWGPERIVSGWWDGAPVQRDYYIALDASQRQGWIYQSQQAWFLHGWFS